MAELLEEHRRGVSKLAGWLLSGLALMVYAHALLQPALAVAGYLPVATEMKCACTASGGRCVVQHDGTADATQSGAYLFAACSCGCCDGAAPDHSVNAQRLAPHLVSLAAHPGLTTHTSRAAPLGMPDLHSVCDLPPEKIPI